jgi:hypothetical protein
VLTFVGVAAATANSSGAIVVVDPPYARGPADHIDLLKNAGDLSGGFYISTPIANV